MASDPSGLWAARGVTARELEVLGYVGRRFGNAEIAEVLSLSKRTVESHVSSLYRKLDVVARSDLVRLAGRAGGPSRVLRVSDDSAGPQPRSGELRRPDDLPRPVAASREARAAAAQLRVRATVHRRSASSRVRAARRIVAESSALKDAKAHRIAERRA